MIDSIEFRFHAERDIVQISHLENVIFSTPWSEKALNEFIKYETNKILVASKDGLVTGYITYSTVLDEVQIANIAVHPDFRKMGIGQKLLDVLLEISQKEDAAIITLEVRESNIPAVSLYKKCGYEVVGVRKNYYTNPTENAILMNLYLKKGN